MDISSRMGERGSDWKAGDAGGVKRNVKDKLAEMIILSLSGNTIM